ncbi:hypothetical protein NBRC111894_3925 [Sporolactobacillus inulinus]|uniref:Uncharacterized protein n=1 Tax=Sporolactobacillus inulinus TaxID=2078 RepID=A0A4Y1ZHD7_9BACL|nr:hypothetical protein NBRC111894_3925 [Sporolactobacillus inulinus]
MSGQSGQGLLGFSENRHKWGFSSLAKGTLDKQILYNLY